MIGIVILGIFGIILENAMVHGPAAGAIGHVLDFLIVLLFISGYLVNFLGVRNKRSFVKRNLLEILLVSFFLFLFFYGKYHFFFISWHRWHDIPAKLVFALGLFGFFKMVVRMRKVGFFLQRLSLHPAQTIMLSFLIIILTGTVLLMLPPATQDGTKLGFINSLFTATSATCVTGLIVVDTATKFSIYGKIVIMFLIQAGGLGIMILAFFTAFLVGRKLSLEERMTISYMLDESNTRNLVRGVKNIVLFTFLFELCGAVLLFTAFKGSVGGIVKTAFFSLFHSISAFCNAGFALFSDNFAGFRTFTFLNLVIAGLIIAGGISFAVLANSFRHLKSGFQRRFLHRDIMLEKLKLNTGIVLTATVILIVVGTLLIYKFEHRSILPEDMKTQYLMAFFQSVTLRTAGFNTMDISKLHAATYSLMILFMFIGGASGSTAGGIKVNTLGVVWAYVRSVFSKEEEVVLMKHSISKDLINQAFLVVLLALTVIFTGALVLTLVESKRFINIIFEAVSAFGTVGLSTGITPQLTGAGKLIIVSLMFIGRLGPLTIVAALARKRRYHLVSYPEGKVSIG